MSTTTISNQRRTTEYSVCVQHHGSNGNKEEMREAESTVEFLSVIRMASPVGCESSRSYCGGGVRSLLEVAGVNAPFLAPKSLTKRCEVQVLWSFVGLSTL